jgi:hypothetical protein
MGSVGHHAGDAGVARETQPTITPLIIIIRQGSFSVDAAFGADRGQATAA